MWKDCGILHYFEISYQNKKVNHIVLLNIESGIAWNPFGKKVPLLGEWVWCEPNNTVKFIEQLTYKDFLCILHSESKDVRPVIDEMQKFFSTPLMAVIGLDISNTINFLNNHWNGLISCPVSIDKDVKYLSIPNYKNIEGLENTNISSLTIAKNLPIVKTMIILMGQPGSGKTTYANELQKEGFVIINENESRLIKSGIEKNINNLKAILSSNIKGVIIDADNCKHVDRKYFANIAESLEIPVVIHWITKPGYRFNKNRDQKTPEIELESYAKNLESPGLYNICAFRVI
jgi:hypothetical protein